MLDKFWKGLMDKRLRQTIHKAAITCDDHLSEAQYIVELETALYDIIRFNKFDPANHILCSNFDESQQERIRAIYDRFDFLRQQGPSKIHYKGL